MSKLKTLQAVRYAAPLREGGSLPAIVETEDGGLYVVKFVGAGQGAKALIAEIVVGELARRLGFRVPELALVNLDASFGRTERDPEIQDLLKASVGNNVGLGFLEGALNFDGVAAADLVDPDMAANLVWLDAFVTNIDRTARNPNLMIHRDKLALIDHGAALYFHHAWPNVTEESMQRPFAAISKDVLMPFASSISDADERLAPRVTESLLRDVAALIPADLAMHAPVGVTAPFGTADELREAYVRALTYRTQNRAFVQAADVARAEVQR